MRESGKAIFPPRDGAKAVTTAPVAFAKACEAFSVSESCYRYRAQLSSKNAKIADLLVRLTHNQRNWGFGLC
ncbi:hypothetical protein MRBBS_2192 [Marinobacter sp. BSs20148]|nr:hypothetical protein MRBBS_2192 [Marinobacter sp. BSs20148]